MRPYGARRDWTELDFPKNRKKRARRALRQEAETDLDTGWFRIGYVTHYFGPYGTSLCGGWTRDGRNPPVTLLPETRCRSCALLEGYADGDEE